MSKPSKPAQAQARSHKAKSVQLVNIAVAVRLLATPLTRDDFDTGPATPGQISALERFRVSAPPERTPFGVAHAVLAHLVERANDPSNLAVLWQLHKLTGEFDADPTMVRTLTYEQAMSTIDREQLARGKRPHRARPKPNA